MAKMCCRVRGNAEPLDRPRIYVTCHPKDQSRYLEKVMQDLLSARDCAVTYTEDMAQRIPEEDRPLDLGRNQLFVVPVTFQLLRTPNRAMDEDIPYALREHIPVLPILMETGLDQIYARPDRFGALQYLDCSRSEPGRIPYPEKLKKYLYELLQGREDMEKVRNAFSARIFLSYRKHDRKTANDLLRMIHSHERLREVAVWFDEYLPLAENFRESIDRTLARSDAFVLVVTPKLLVRGNFVMEVEYPAAVRAGIPIVPVMAEHTDPKMLAQWYPGLPECLDMQDRAAVWERILSLIPEREDGDSPEDRERYYSDLYAIGLAYQQGIDVEVDRERGLELITTAAEHGSFFAMERLHIMYRIGLGVRIDYRKAFQWAQAVVSYWTERLGEADGITCGAKVNLALAYMELGDHRKALQINEEVYEDYCRLYGPEDPETLTALNNLSICCSELGEHRRALELKERLYAIKSRLLGEDHPQTLTVLNDLAIVQEDLGSYREALELHQRIYEQRCRILGEDHPDTITTMSALATDWGSLGEYKRAKELRERVLNQRLRLAGEEHPDTVDAASDLASSMNDLGDHRTALAIYSRVCQQRRELLGEDHPKTLAAMSNLAIAYSYNSKFRAARNMLNAVYEARVRLLGEEHPDTIATLNNLSESCRDLGDYRGMLKMRKKVYELRCKSLGPEHPDTLETLNGLATCYLLVEDRKKAFGTRNQAYELSCRILGERHPKTVGILGDLAATYGHFGEYAAALPVQEQACALYAELRGEEHPETLDAMNNLSLTLYNLGEYRKAMEYKEKEYAIRCRLRGEDDQSMIQSLCNMSLICHGLGEYEKAFQYASKAYEGQCRLTGEKHPMAQKMKMNVNIMEWDLRIHQMSGVSGKPADGQAPMEPGSRQREATAELQEYEAYERDLAQAEEEYAKLLREGTAHLTGPEERKVMPPAAEQPETEKGTGVLSGMRSLFRKWRGNQD